MEYTPMVALCLLATPLITAMLWSSVASRYMRSTYSKSQPSLDDLPDDIILEICALLKNSTSVKERRDARYNNRPRSFKQELNRIDCWDFSWKFLLMKRPRRYTPLKALSGTSRRMRQLAAPDLFRAVLIEHDWNWNQALSGLDCMNNSAAAHDYAESFSIQLWLEDSWYDWWKDDSMHRGPRPPRRLAPRLADVLRKLERIHDLTLNIPEYHTEVFRKAFQKTNVTLPCVKTLVLGPHMDWVIAMCPNVERISSGGNWLHSNVDGDYKHRHSFELVRSAGTASNLKHLEVFEWWSEEHLDWVLQYTPWIESLAMPGGNYSSSIRKLLPTLSRLTNLKSLVLADASSLHVGFDPPGCGNCYMGPGGEQYRLQVAAEGRRATERVARTVFARLRTLKELWVGDYSKAVVVRTASGAVEEVVWTYGHRLRTCK